VPSQWDKNVKGLRTIPNTVEEFTGFYKGNDLLGGDFLGYGPANHFRPVRNGTARVRNIQLPSAWEHGAVPDTKHLLKSQEIMDRINAYRPSPECHVVVPENEETMRADTLYLFWAQDVLFSVKKQWVRELQALIRSRREPGLTTPAQSGAVSIPSHHGT
jgi:hypothetical protein